MPTMPENLSVLDEFLIDPKLMAIEPAPIRFSEELTRIINTAEERELPMVFAYVDENNALRQSFRGSIHVHGPQQLAFWNRAPKGGFINSVEAGYDAVCTTYREPGSQRVLQFHGRAQVVRDEDESKRIWNQCPELERNLTHGQKGVAVIIELDRVQGVDQSPETGEWEAFVMTRA